MCFCSFCGKGPFTSSSRLNTHIGHSLNCNEAQRQEWGIYATNMWDNTSSRDETQQLASPLILDNEELANLPDTTLEDDLQELEYLPDTEPDLEVPHHVPECHRSTLNNAEEELHPANYIQESPTNLGAGAVWGEEIPFFEKLRQEQIQNKLSM